MAEKTTRIRPLTSMAGSNLVLVPGREADVPEALAKALVNDGRAELVNAPAPKTGKRQRGERTGSGPAGGAETR